MKKFSLGFTFIELLIVMVIISLIAVSAPVFYSRFLLQNAVSNAYDQLAGSLRKAELYSMMGKQNSAWSVNFSSNTITVYKGSVFASRDQTLDETFSVNTSVSISGLTDLSFAKVTGLPSATAAITISSGSNSESITVNSQGGISK